MATKTTNKVKATAKKAAAKTETKVENTAQKTTAILRKGMLAYIGMYGAAYEQAQTRFTQAREATDGLFDTLVEKGEEIEVQATELLKDTQSKVTATYKQNAKKVRSALPVSANDRVEELEAEIAALNKKIVAVSKKAKKTVVSKAAKAADTVEKTAAKVETAIEKAA
jgi:hypothetical protein